MKYARIAIFFIFYFYSNIGFAIEHAFLVQNSGWMDPFYNDPRSRFKQLVFRVIDQATDDGDSITVAAVNQADSVNKSPEILYQGAASQLPSKTLNSLSIARKATGAWADTDLREAVGRTANGIFKGRSGIIWIFTNNRNSPGNDPATAERNLEFYNLLHDNPSIHRTIAYPVRMPLVGKNYQTTGMMVYALAYGKAAGDALRVIASSNKITVFRGAPARLKPLDEEAVSIIGPKVRTPGIDVQLASGGAGLNFYFTAQDIPDEILLSARIRNQFYPYRIDSANVTARFADLTDQDLFIDVEPAGINSLSPGEEALVNVRIRVPTKRVPSAWSAESIAAMGDRVPLRAVIDLELDDQKLSVDPSFERKLAEIFPGDPLSQVFRPSSRVKASTERIPITFFIQYPLMPFWVTVLSTLGLLAALLFALNSLRSAKTYTFNVDGDRQTIRLRARQTAQIFDARNQLVGTVVRPIFGAPTCQPEPGKSLRLS